MLFWLLWIVVVIGGFFMGIGYLLAAYQNNFDLSTTLNAAIYLVCAIYGLPKFAKFIRNR